jgi:hypothetical protein
MRRTRPRHLRPEPKSLMSDELVAPAVASKVKVPVLVLVLVTGHLNIKLKRNTYCVCRQDTVMTLEIMCRGMQGHPQFLTIVNPEFIPASPN